jgi:hypothetical protein
MKLIAKKLDRHQLIAFGLLGLALLFGLSLLFFHFTAASPHCEPRQDDPEGHLFKICAYIITNQIDVSPADPTAYQIKRIEPRAENGREVLWVFLNCCYLGDIAIIDKETGQVIKFHVGAQ